jgi:hypothetical protein
VSIYTPNLNAHKNQTKRDNKKNLAPLDGEKSELSFKVYKLHYAQQQRAAFYVELRHDVVTNRFFHISDDKKFKTNNKLAIF